MIARLASGETTVTELAAPAERLRPSDGATTAFVAT